MAQENFVNNDDGFQRFYGISSATLYKHAPCKKKQVRGNQMSFFNKGILKEIMTRAKLHNIFLQIRVRKIESLKSKETFVSLLRKVIKRYFETLNEKSVIDNKLLWKTV